MATPLRDRRRSPALVTAGFCSRRPASRCSAARSARRRPAHAPLGSGSASARPAAASVRAASSSRATRCGAVGHSAHAARARSSRRAWGPRAGGRGLLARAPRRMGRRGWTPGRLFTPDATCRARRFYEREGWATPPAPALRAQGSGFVMVEYRRALGHASPRWQSKLSEYERKRDFAKTTEPRAPGEDGPRAAGRRASSSRSTTPGAALGPAPRARRRGGVAGRCRTASRSTPKENRLAVRTEDHPLEYLEFEGDIPAGSYGAGTMRIWDRGTFESRSGSRQEGRRSTLHGERVKGRYALFRWAARTRTG